MLSETEGLFTPTGQQAPTRQEFQDWLRTSFRQLLGGKSPEIDALIAAITPHSFRAGLAGDMWREGINWRVIIKFGRWHDKRAMEQYARDALVQRLQTISITPIQDIEARRQAITSTGARSRTASSQQQRHKGHIARWADYERALQHARTGTGTNQGPRKRRGERFANDSSRKKSKQTRDATAAPRTGSHNRRLGNQRPRVRGIEDPPTIPGTPRSPLQWQR